MTIELIETFLTILKYKNISAAASKLYTSQSTISHRLQLLEDEVGIPLFLRRRGQRSVELTSGGEAFIPIAERWMSVFRDTRRLKDCSLRQNLIIGSIDSCTFLPLYRQHLKAVPDIRLSVLTYHTGEIYHMLESRKIDIGYVYSLRHYPDILSRPIYQDQMVLICHKDSPYHQNMEPSELPAEKEIFLRWSSDYQMWHDYYWPGEKSLMTLGTGAQLPRYLDVPDRWTIAPSSVYQTLNNQENFSLYSLAMSPPSIFCYEILHRYPKPSIEKTIQRFQQEVQTFIDSNNTIHVIHP